MSILIMGATGNTGRAVVKQLQALGKDFSVMVRSADKATALEVSPAQVRLGSFDDVDSLKSALAGIERVYLAMPAHPDNFQWTENLIAAAKDAGVKHLVKLSGLGASQQAGSAIIRTHAETDALIKQSGLAYTLLQPNSFFQNLYGSLASIQASGQFYLPLADAAQSVIDINDVAAVAVAALIQDGHAGKTYLLTGPRALTFAEQASLISQAAGKPVQYVPVSQQAAHEAMAAAGMDPWLADALSEILAWFGQGGYDQVSGDVETVLGRKPRSFDAFAGEFVQAL